MPDTQLALLSTSSSISSRSDEVREAILSIKTTLMKRALELGRLLREARDNDYAHAWGYPRFGDWVEQESGLDMSARSAYDLIKIVEQSERLAISDEALERVKISKLKQIFTLKDGEMSDDDIRELVANAETASLETVKEIVGIAKQQEWANRNYKFDKTAYEEIISPAIERAKMEYGSTMSEEEENVDISDSKAFEVICADYISGPSFEGEYGIVDAVFEDSAQVGA